MSAFISAERSALREELIPFLTVALKVDREANMGIVGDVKQELRKVNALKINYTTGIGDVETNLNWFTLLFLNIKGVLFRMPFLVHV